MTLTKKAQRIYKQVDALTGGSLGILKRAWQRFAEARASEAAASIAYYAVFSLFPLLLCLVGVVGFILTRDRVHQLVLNVTADALPAAKALVEENIQTVLERRGTLGLVGLIGLLWSATGVFSTLARNINRAWPDVRTRNFVERRMVALGMVGTLLTLLIVSLLSTTVLDTLSGFEIPLWGGISVYETAGWKAFSRVLPWLFTFLMFLGLYRWVPSADVPWAAAFWGALVSALAWEAAKRSFAWYLGSGLVRYKLVYGSLGAVVALMLWIYLSSWIALFGAHLCATLTNSTDVDRLGALESE
ncbi:MAG: YihY/virulence factor BrkB family protein [Anaerolineae bacterium]|nr:YihY/virulence factor BrkB family protein [Anaerolineae bacterium]